MNWDGNYILFPLELCQQAGLDRNASTPTYGWNAGDRLFVPLLCITLRNSGCPLPGGSHSPAQGSEASLGVWEKKWEWISQKPLIRKLPKQASGEWLHSRGVSYLLCHWGMLRSISWPVPSALVFSCLFPSSWWRGCASACRWGRVWASCIRNLI